MVIGAPSHDTGRTMAETHGTCPECKQGDLITISMSVSDRDLTFTTCHLCESKWWFRDGELVPLTSVIDLVVRK
jgi:DNA polymerase III alpha subunit (gram-positive type)